MEGHRDATAIRIKQKGAALYASRMAPASSVPLPDRPYVHLFVARGAIDLEGAGRLEEGDTARLTGAEGQMVTADGDAEILVWEIRSELPEGD
jgi:redox-sensitive bicupin YhaK (pirin superfamily)